MPSEEIDSVVRALSEEDGNRPGRSVHDDEVSRRPPRMFVSDSLTLGKLSIVELLDAGEQCG